MNFHPVVNFINIKCANFLYKLHFGSSFSIYMYIVKAAETTFVRKICTFNIDEIDTWCFIVSIIPSIEIFWSVNIRISRDWYMSIKNVGKEERKVFWFQISSLWFYLHIFGNSFLVSILKFGIQGHTKNLKRTFYL